MSKGIAGIALVGLFCVMLIPAPGLMGLLIGSACVLVIAIIAAMLLIERIAAALVQPMIEAIRRNRAAKKRRRSLHIGSGIVRKA